MLRGFNRKSTPQVKNGRVQKKHNGHETADYYNSPQRLPVIDRKRPGPGYRHVLKQKDIHDFINILPNWPELSKGLNGIILAPGEWGTYGYHLPGVVHICAWDKEYWFALTSQGYEDEREFLELLGVPIERRKGGVLCKFNENTARAHQLLGTLLHELGHHYDRITTKSQIDASRGEPYADEYARRYAERIWDSYTKVFEM